MQTSMLRLRVRCVTAEDSFKQGTVDILADNIDSAIASAKELVSVSSFK